MFMTRVVSSASFALQLWMEESKSKLILDSERYVHCSPSVQNIWILFYFIASSCQSFSPSLTPRRSLLSLSCLRTSDVISQASSSHRQLWNKLEKKMFCQVLRAWLQPGAQCLTSSCRSVHKLASINSTKNLSQNKVGGMLYPFSVLEPYLDRFVVLRLCCSAVSYHC